MLVLRRKRDETMVINGPCVLTVTHIGPQTVQIGIEADKSTTILRGELAAAIQNDQQTKSGAV